MQELSTGEVSEAGTDRRLFPHSYGDDLPVAAFATVPGNSALTLIRCSGKSAIEKFSSVFSRKNFIDAPGNKVIHGWIVNSGEKIDEVLVSVFRAPKSYTGEDCLDICCHGGGITGKAVMDALISAGFREALKGEFTFRAFINGKLDLTKSESVMEIVSAKTETGRRHASSRLAGTLYKCIEEIKSQMVRVLAAAEIFLDYSEDEVSADAEEAAGRLPEKETALEVLARLKKLSCSWQIERIYQKGVTVVIAGRPNSGKSSLFNSFLKEDRSIVTNIPGTTRDWIEAQVSIKGIPVRLIDTAGLRDSADSIEKIGMERSRLLMEEAELILYLIDGTQGVTEEDIELINELSNKKNQTLILWNKFDIAPCPSFPNYGMPSVPSDSPAGLIVRERLLIPHSSSAPLRFCESFIKISAITGEGLDELCAAIASAIMPEADALNETQASLGTERQKNLVDNAISALQEALLLEEREEPLDLIAPLLREAVNALGEITGEVSTSDILEEMFSRFCVGK